MAALIVSEYGIRETFGRRGLWLDPWLTDRILTRSAAKRACPDLPLVTYEKEGRSAEFNALCEGDSRFNGFYGSGIVDAFAAVTLGGHG